MPEITFIQNIVVWILPTLFAITFHEVAHGFVASKLGDKTAQMLGRLTLNPIKHIDLFGTVLIPLVLFWAGGFVFGWAKPVPVNPANFRSPRRDMALVALAGPFSNFLMAFFWTFIAKLGFLLQTHDVSMGMPIGLMGKSGIIVNIILMVLNLIPILPLDGGRILSALLPKRAAYYFDRVEPYGIFILLFLLYLRIINSILEPLANHLISFIVSIVGIR